MSDADNLLFALAEGLIEDVGVLLHLPNPNHLSSHRRGRCDPISDSFIFTSRLLPIHKRRPTGDRGTGVDEPRLPGSVDPMETASWRLKPSIGPVRSDLDLDWLDMH